MTPKDWNTQEEAIAAAKAEILAAIGNTDAKLELGMVKSVQWGRYNGYPNREISISPVNVDKSVAFATGGSFTSATSIVYVYEFTSNTIRLGAQGTSTNTTLGASWHVVEFY